ncbi:hypothetical protein ACJMK2_001071 [Sinanodonta woodiana]|uniref:alanine transaminase n=1 Tax=Sinanodonta woodiana TaxID=1069815 RepID=A0ABD3XTE0_SINWO
MSDSQSIDVVHGGTKVLTMETLNPNVVKMEYAVLGPIYIRALELEKELAEGTPKPFGAILKGNIGDCHATGQTPITFVRQVIALCTYPLLLEDPMFPEDAKQRARGILAACSGHSVGSYSASPGIAVFQKDVAAYISQRDGQPCCSNNIFLCTGATEGIRIVLKMLMTGKSGSEQAGIMIPVPQYPLYSATLTEFNACPIPYYLDEENNWSLEVDELNRALTAAKGKCIPRAICVINPGNPTGQVLSKENIENIIRFAHKEGLVILADEVYQYNVYAKGSQFFSFKKVLIEMGSPYCSHELASFMSTSKGFMGECGFRGGYCEMANFQDDVQKCLLKSISARLCPPVLGQIVMSILTNPPQEGDSSYAKFQDEKSNVLSVLAEKARLITDLFNSIEGISCNEVQGAMYAFPRIYLPDKAIDAARKLNQNPDFFYCSQLLEETGICTVPGSGFGQKEGTYHFRITILPPLEDIRRILGLFKSFHLRFLDKYK